MLIHFDNFNLYGNSASNALEFYSIFSGSIVPDPDEDAIGSAARLGPSSDAILKKYLNHSNGASHGIGINAQIMLSSLPTDSGMLPRIMQWSGIGGLEVGYDEIMYVVVLTTGHVLVTQSRNMEPGFTLGISDRPVVTPGVWQNFEAFYHSDVGTAATFELRLEGETIIYADNFGTMFFADNTFHDPTIVGVSFSTRDNFIGAGPGVYVKNVAFWNEEGAENNTFLGPLIVHNMLPAADVTAGDWEPIGGETISDVLDNIPFTTDIYAMADPEASVDEGGGAPFVVDLQDASAAWNVLGVLAFCATRKIDFGYASLQIGVDSEEDEALGAEIFPTQTSRVYFQDFSLDPATGLTWTVSALNAARFKLTRLT